VNIVDGKLVSTERWEDKEAVITNELLEDDDHWLTVISLKLAN